MKIISAAVITLALVASSAPLSAHHSWPVNTDKLVTVKGTITRVEWGNPHPMFTIEVREDGTMKQLSGDFWAYSIFYFGSQRRRFERVFSPLGKVYQGMGPVEIQETL